MALEEGLELGTDPLDLRGTIRRESPVKTFCVNLRRPFLLESVMRKGAKLNLCVASIAISNLRFGRQRRQKRFLDETLIGLLNRSSSNEACEPKKGQAFKQYCLYMVIRDMYVDQ